MNATPPIRPTTSKQEMQIACELILQHWVLQNTLWWQFVTVTYGVCNRIVWMFAYWWRGIYAHVAYDGGAKLSDDRDSACVPYAAISSSLSI